MVLDLDVEVVGRDRQPLQRLQYQADGEGVGLLRPQARVAAEDGVVLTGGVVIDDARTVLGRSDPGTLALDQGRRGPLPGKASQAACAWIPGQVEQTQALGTEQFDDVC